jgi:UDP-GlcNAc:undecaprenyl-phosphate GlcNAc-1-phosphate transferase
MLILFTGLLSALLTRLQIHANSRLGLTAQPRADRWSAEPTPTSGGLAIFLSCAAAYWLACPGHYPRIALAVAALWIFGFVDDRLHLLPWTKLAVQVAAAGFVVLGGVAFPLTASYPVNVALSMFWIVLITNAFNMIDNMDGLCTGVVIVICLFRSCLLASEGYRVDADLSAILAAAFAGFLIFNYPPARIFMGDCGSMPAGFALGALALAGPLQRKEGLIVGIFYPALTFAYPIFDLTLVSTLRKLTGRPISQGGCDHSSHRLASLGLDQRQVVWILWLLSACGASLGITIHFMPDALFSAGALLLGMLSMLALSLAKLPGYPQPDLMWLRRRKLWIQPDAHRFPGTNHGLSGPHSLDSTVAFVLASETPSVILPNPMEAACSRTTASPR